MNEEKKSLFGTLLDNYSNDIPKVGDVVKCVVMSANTQEVKLDIGGVMTGVVRGNELFREADEYLSLKPGDEVEATVIEAENERGELELSFRYAGQEKARQAIIDAHDKKDIVKVRIMAANKGGLLANFRQISGFIPVSQLSPEKYPRVEGGDKNKIFLQLKNFVGQEMDVKVITLNEKEDKIIFSEKEAWLEKRKDIISKYHVGSVVEGEVTAVTDFGAFIKFGDNLEGLIHISELAWQRVDDPSMICKIGDMIKAEIVSMDGSKIFLSAKKLQRDPWDEVEKKFKIGQQVSGEVVKVNPFGLFVSLDDDIHGLAHINYLGLDANQKIQEAFREGEKRDFYIISLEPKEHRLGLSVEKLEKKEEKTEGEEAKADDKEEKPAKAKKKEVKESEDETAKAE